MAHNLEGFKLGVKGETLNFLEIIILRRVDIDQGQRISELIEDININRNIITSLIKKMIGRGYIERTQSTKDKRAYLLKLTKSGVEVVEKSYILQKKNLDFVLEDITLNEEKAILKFLSKLNQLDRI